MSDEPEKATEPEAIPREPFIKIAVMKPEENPGMLAGRPIGFNEELAEQILDYLTTGLTQADIGDKEDMPSAKTIGRWRRRFPEFDKQCMDAVRQSAFWLQQAGLAASRGEGHGLAQTDIAWARLEIETALEVSARRLGHVAHMEGAMNKEPDGQDAKVIDGSYEIVTTADDPKFLEAIAGWEKITGVKSTQTREDEAKAAAANAK